MSDHEASQDQPNEKAPEGPWSDLVRPAQLPAEGQTPPPAWPQAADQATPVAWPSAEAPALAEGAEASAVAPSEAAAPLASAAPDAQADAMASEAPAVTSLPFAAAASAAEDVEEGAWGQRVRAKRRKSPWRRLATSVGLLVGGVALLWVGFKVAGVWSSPATLKAAGLGDRLSVVVAGLDPTPLPTDAMAKETAYLADVVHLLHLDERAGRAFVLTFPRDTRATLAGVGEGALGDALALGGPAMLSETLAGLTGLEANHQVVMDFDGARSAIKELGPQEVYVPAPLKIEDAAAKFKLQLPAGWLKLGANELLAYAYRREDGAELERLARQQGILHRYQQRLQGAFVGWWLGGAAERSMATLRTDLSKRGFAGAVRAWAALPPSAIAYAILPGTVDPKGRYLISPTRWEGLKSRLLASPGRRTPAEAKPTLEILHQGDDAKAQALADRLSNLGFQVRKVASAPVDPSETVIVDRSRADERSAAVLAALDGMSGGARVVVDPDPAFTATYTLRLGAAFFRK